MGKAGVIIAAAGSGTRMGFGKNKVLLPLLGMPILIRSIKKFTSQAWVKEIIVVVRREDYSEIDNLIKQWDVRIDQLIIGGKRRQDSVALGLQSLSDDIEWVFIHDAARPLIESKVINDAYTQVQKYQAIGVAVPVKDTIKVINNEQVVENTPNRAKLWAIQTPQAFSYSLIKQAYQQAEINGWEGTDDCSLVENMGFPVKLIAGSYSNIKITTKEDLQLAKVLLKMQTGGSLVMKSGIGYDVHRLVKERQLILGGVKIDHPCGLAGHSDADVVTHALMDSLLGAAGLGDIGRHFPDTEPEYQGISSIELLKQVTAKLSSLNYQVNNVDLVIIAQRPKLAPYVERMRSVLAEVLGIDPGNINIKATTTEGLGFCGREEGIAAFACATILGLS